jgi:hypothetical protein
VTLKPGKHSRIYNVDGLIIMSELFYSFQRMEYVHIVNWTMKFEFCGHVLCEHTESGIFGDHLPKGLVEMQNKLLRKGYLSIEELLKNTPLVPLYDPYDETILNEFVQRAIQCIMEQDAA